MSDAALRDASALAAEGRMEEALTRLGGSWETSPAAALLAARCLLDRPDPVAALAVLPRAAAPDAPANERRDALRLLGRLLTGFGIDLLAARAYRALLALRPGDAEARFLFGRALLAAGWPDLALASFRLLPAPLPGWWRQSAGAAASRLAAARREAKAALPACRAGTPPGEGAIRAVLEAGRPTAAGRALQSRPDLAWLAPMIEERRRWPEDMPAPPDAAPPALAAWLLRRGAVAEAEAAQAPLPEEALDGRARLLRGRLLLLRGDIAGAEALAAAALARARRRSDHARLLLTGQVLGSRIGMLRAGGLPPADPALADLPVVQYWDAPDPPADVAAVLESWARWHPGRPVLRFHRATARAFLAESWGERAVQAFDAAGHPAVEADLLRLAVLARGGGIWADADEACLADWSPVLAALPPGGLAAAFSDEIPYYVHNQVLAARPGSEAAQAAAEEAIALLRRRKGGAFEVWSGTGPGLLTRIAAASPGAVRLLSPATFRRFAAGAYDLAYKIDRAADWRPG